MKLSIVIPCYNEAENIPLLLERYAEAIARPDVEVVLVNNGSTDRTAEILGQAMGKYKAFLKIVTIPVNQGYGFGIVSGLREASGEFLGWTHGDLQTSPKDVLRGLDIIEASQNNPLLYVKGSRRGRPLFDLVFTWGMSVIESTYLGAALWDINAQPNIFHKSFFAEWANPPRDFALDLYALYLAKKKGLKVARLPVQFPQRIHGTSKWNTGILAKWKFIKRTVSFSTGLKKSLGDLELKTSNNADLR